MMVKNSKRRCIKIPPELGLKKHINFAFHPQNVVNLLSCNQCNVQYVDKSKHMIFRSRYQHFKEEVCVRSL